MKIRTVGAELFHVDGRKDRQTDRRAGMMMLTVFSISPTSLKMFYVQFCMRLFSRRYMSELYRFWSH